MRPWFVVFSPYSSAFGTVASSRLEVGIFSATDVHALFCAISMLASHASSIRCVAIRFPPSSNTEITIWIPIFDASSSAPAIICFVFSMFNLLFMYSLLFNYSIQILLSFVLNPFSHALVTFLKPSYTGLNIQSNEMFWISIKKSGRENSRLQLRFSGIYGGQGCSL